MAPDQHRTTTRVLDILERVAASTAGMTLAELAQTLDAPKSSLFPIVHTLEGRRYLRQLGSTGRYVIGPEPLALGAAFSTKKEIEMLSQIMNDISERCQETCQLGILDRGHVLYIKKKDSPLPIRMISTVGTRLPANATALGKALLSSLTDEQVRGLFPDGLPALTAQTITDPEALLAQLRAIRTGAIAMEWEESTDQLACWAVPLWHQGKVFAAFSVSVPVYRCQEDKIALVRQCLLDAQARVERLPGDLDLAAFRE